MVQEFIVDCIYISSPHICSSHESHQSGHFRMDFLLYAFAIRTIAATQAVVYAGVSGTSSPFH